MNHNPNLNRKRSKVFAFGTGQLALHKSSGTKVKVMGARRSRNGLLIVALITGGTKKGSLIVAKASSFAARASKTTPTALVVGV
jgi:hypothetical protein